MRQRSCRSRGDSALLPAKYFSKLRVTGQEEICTALESRWRRTVASGAAAAALAVVARGEYGQARRAEANGDSHSNTVGTFLVRVSREGEIGTHSWTNGRHPIPCDGLVSSSCFAPGRKTSLSPMTIFVSL